MSGQSNGLVVNRGPPKRRNANTQKHPEEKVVEQAPIVSGHTKEHRVNFVAGAKTSISKQGTWDGSCRSKADAPASARGFPSGGSLTFESSCEKKKK